MSASDATVAKLFRQNPSDCLYLAETTIYGVDVALAIVAAVLVATALILLGVGSRLNYYCATGE
jgi:hypothetical protein